MGKPENECIIRIGNGEKTWDVPANYLTIVFPISDEDRQQLEQQEFRNRLRDKELTEHIRKLVVQFEDQNFETKDTPSASATKTTTLAAYMDFKWTKMYFMLCWITATAGCGRCRFLTCAP